MLRSKQCQSLVGNKCSFITNAPYRVCFSFCLDAKRNKRSRLSLFARPATDSKAKTKEKRLSIISFCFLTLSSPCGYPVQPARSGSLTDKSHLQASAPVHQRHSRWLTSEAGVKLNVPKGNKFSLASKLKSGRRATQHKAFLIPFAALGKRNTSNL